jgi:hypothetical protein
MEGVEQILYLGVVISCDGKNTKGEPGTAELGTNTVL